MSWGAVAVAGAGIVTGVMGKKSADKAAKGAAGAQGAASAAEIAEAKRQFDAVQKLLSPYVEAGSGRAATAGGEFDAEQYLRDNPDVAAHPVYGQDPLAHYYRYGRKEGRAFPKTQGTPGTTGAIDIQKDILGINGPEAQQRAIASVQGSPEFSALLSQGENSIRQNAAATGGLRGGNIQSALSEFSPRLLSSLIQQRFQNLGSLSAMGQAAATGTAAAAQQTGQQIGGALGDLGASQAGLALARGQNQAQLYGTLGNAAGMAIGKVF